MPLGGGVFNNPWDKIASGMAKANFGCNSPAQEAMV